MAKLVVKQSAKAHGPLVEVLWHFETFVNTDHVSLKFYNATPTYFI